MSTVWKPLGRNLIESPALIVTLPGKKALASTPPF
jgi:hypothetical protein